jgi:Holliday junction resolvase
MGNSKKPMSEITDVLYRIKRGLSSYVSYLAACEMNSAFSEYVLYEPILRILMARGFNVECEYAHDGIKQGKNGDKKRIDFYAYKENKRMAIEVKWLKNAKLNIDNDKQKLVEIISSDNTITPLLCVFGRKKYLEPLIVEESLKERGNAVFADLGKTRYGCRIFELKNFNK